MSFVKQVAKVMAKNKNVKFGAGMKPPKQTRVSPARIAGEKFMKSRGKLGVGSGLLNQAAGAMRNRNNIIGKALKK